MATTSPSVCLASSPTPEALSAPTSIVEPTPTLLSTHSLHSILTAISEDRLAPLSEDPRAKRLSLVNHRIEAGLPIATDRSSTEDANDAGMTMGQEEILHFCRAIRSSRFVRALMGEGESSGVADKGQEGDVSSSSSGSGSSSVASTSRSESPEDMIGGKADDRSGEASLCRASTAEGTSIAPSAVPDGPARLCTFPPYPAGKSQPSLLHFYSHSPSLLPPPPLPLPRPRTPPPPRSAKPLPSDQESSVGCVESNDEGYDAGASHDGETDREQEQWWDEGSDEEAHLRELEKELNRLLERRRALDAGGKDQRDGCMRQFLRQGGPCCCVM
mmetsp:Transcript_8684/g.24839  ORF Transcript_8684/g.24839 Transcript_8684/m.24839 type:complete len:330 (-) Transcript_8684:236-1225(-)